jgi:hypothetical protein
LIHYYSLSGLLPLPSPLSPLPTPHSPPPSPRFHLAPTEFFSQPSTPPPTPTPPRVVLPERMVYPLPRFSGRTGGSIQGRKKPGSGRVATSKIGGGTTSPRAGKPRAEDLGKNKCAWVRHPPGNEVRSGFFDPPTDGARRTHKREPCENQGRARRCNRGRKPRRPLASKRGREGVASRTIRKSEDLPRRSARSLTDRGLP